MWIGEGARRGLPASLWSIEIGAHLIEKDKVRRSDVWQWQQ